MHYLVYRFSLFVMLLPLFTQRTQLPAEGLGALPPGGIHTSGGRSVESLVKEVFAKGACDNISNIRVIGNPGGMGYFDNGKSSIGMEEGIILATGPIGQAEGPNRVGDRSGNFDDALGDPDLAKLSTHRILDAVGIEFDFTPLDSFVRFRYVFASEEYCEFVGSVYNDVFGFFVSGPGIEGAFSRNSKNVALIPGTNAYVSINSVNHNQNSGYFIRNELEKDARQCGIPPVSSPYRELIEYDGFTTILTATLQLIPCETYHIRFVVSDVADRHYDSAVFLEAGSFNIGGTVRVSAVGNQQNNAMEGCEPAAFVFQRGESDNVDQPLSVRFKIAEGSTATENEDFAALPRTVTIPAGQQSVRVPVNVFNDGIPESPEKIAIELDIPCACYSGRTELPVIDAPSLQANLPQALVCRSATTTLQPSVSGGVPPYTYRWSNGATRSSIGVTVGLADAYSVTVSDQCGNMAVDSTKVAIIEPPSATLSGAAEICQGDTARLPVQLVGTPPWRLTYRLEGVTQPVLTITTLPGSIAATHAGQYELLQVEDAGCVGTAAGVAQVSVLKVEVASDIQNVRCADGADGRIALQPLGHLAPFRYAWQQNLGNGPQVSNLPAGSYQVTVTNAKDCQGIFEFTIAEPLPLTPIVFNCNDLKNPQFQLSTGGGTPPYRYSVDGKTFTDASLFQTLEPGKTYALTIRDAEDCEIRQTLTLPPVYEKMVELPPTLELNIGEIYQFQPQLNLAPQLLTRIEWLSGEHLSCTDCLQPQVEGLTAGIYTLRLTDIFGCVDTASVQLLLNREVDVYIPTAFSPNGDHFNDFFTVYADAHQVQRVIALRVFDRWGNQVFAAHDFAPNDERTGWDGYVNGDLPNNAVFVYTATLRLRDGTERIEKGQVLLVR